MRISRVLLATCVFILGGQSNSGIAQSSASQGVPRTAKIEVTLLNAAGSPVAATSWEIAYEFRLATEADVWNSSRSGNPNGAEQRAGELIKKGSLTQIINSPKPQTLTLEIPLNKQAQERLKTQPKTRLVLTGKNMTPENLKLLKEQERASHIFMFYSVVNVHDGKLKKTVVIPISRGWDFSNYPDARFAITVEVKDFSTYSWKSK